MIELKRKIYKVLQTTWERSYDLSQLSFLQKIIFFFLCCCEPFYRLGFCFVCWYKKKLRNTASFPWKIISVGNISVGGTGKSVFTSFLVTNLSANAAIIMRGYQWQKTGDASSKIIAPGMTTKNLVSLVGDEASMLSQNLNIPVVVGRDRRCSSEILRQWATERNKQLDYVVLDDAYQNFALKKDFEILLLDARHPFENNHCLPAGRLREKDISRADAIILTHADEIAAQKFGAVQQQLEQRIGKDRVFAGKHKGVGVYNEHTKKLLTPDEIKKFKMLVFAGIGSFEGFKKTIFNQGVEVGEAIEFPDHYEYQYRDLSWLFSCAQPSGCNALITTQKDWQKIIQFDLPKNITVFTLPVVFDFLSPTESKKFFLLLNRTVGLR